MSSTALRQEIHQMLDELPPEILPELVDFRLLALQGKSGNTWSPGQGSDTLVHGWGDQPGSSSRVGGDELLSL